MPITGNPYNTVNVFTSGSVTSPLPVTSSQVAPVWVTGSVTVNTATISISGATFNELSVGATGAIAPVSATLIGGVDSSGVLQPFHTDASGNLIVNVINSTTSSFAGNVNITQSIPLTVTSSQANPLWITGTTLAVDIKNSTINVTATIGSTVPTGAVAPTTATMVGFVDPGGNLMPGLVISGAQVITGTVHLDNTTLTVSQSNLPATQSVYVVNQQSSSITGTVTVSGTGVFFVQEQSPVTGVYVLGTATFSQSNVPSTQSVYVVNQTSGSVTVSGTASVSVTNFPATQQVSISGVSLVSGALPVTGNITVTNEMSGTVTVTSSQADPVWVTGAVGMIQSGAFAAQVSGVVTATFTGSVPVSTGTFPVVTVTQGGAWAAQVSGVVGITQSGALAAQISGVVTATFTGNLPIGTLTVTASSATPAYVAFTGNLPVGSHAVTQGGAWTSQVSGVIGITQSGALAAQVSGVVTATFTGSVPVTSTQADPVWVLGTSSISNFPSGFNVNVTASVPTTATLSGLGILDTNNQFSGTLGNSAIFTGSATDVSDYATIEVSIFANQDSLANGVQLQFSPDSTNWNDAFVGTFFAGRPAPNDGQIYTVGVRSKYFRVVYNNNSSATVRIYTVLKKFGISPDMIDINETLVSSHHASVVKAVLGGRIGTTYSDVAVSSSALSVYFATSPTVSISGVTPVSGAMPITGNIVVTNEMSGTVTVTSSLANPVIVVYSGTQVVSASNYLTTSSGQLQASGSALGWQFITGTVHVDNTSAQPVWVTGTITSVASASGTFTAIENSVGPTASYVPGSATFVAGVDSSDILRGLSVTNSGVLYTVAGQDKAGVGTFTLTSVTTGSTTVLTSNPGRKGAMLFNTTSAYLLIALGFTATTGNYSLRLPGSGILEIPFFFTGIVNAISPISGSYVVNATEFTA